MKEVQRPTITLQVTCGLVRKKHLRDTLNASMWEFEKTINYLRENDPEFQKAYQPYEKRWAIPERLAVQFVEHVCPGWEIVVEV